MPPSIVVRFGGNLDDLKKALGEGKVLIQNTSSSMDKLAAKLSGSKAKNDAEVWVGAIRKIGDATKLTARDQERANQVMQRAIAYYKAAGQQIPADIQKIADATRRAGNATDSLLGGIGKTAAGFAAGYASIATLQRGLGMLTGLIGDSIQAYAEQEMAIRKMTAALQAQGTATPEVITGYKNLASSFQQTTAFGDELLIEMQALLVEVGNVAPQQMKAALQASTDLAAGLGIDLRQATMLVGKAFAGETGTLKRYGIVVDETKLKAEGVSAVLEAVNDKFGGQATAQVDTYTGRIEQLTNAWGDLKEAIGGAVAADPFLGKGIAGTTSALAGVTRSLSEQGLWKSALMYSLAPGAAFDTFGALGRAPLPEPTFYGPELPPGFKPPGAGGRPRRPTAGEDWFGLQEIDRARDLIGLVGRASEMSSDKQDELRRRLLAGADAADRLGRSVQAAALRAGAGLVPLQTRALGLSQLTMAPLSPEGNVPELLAQPLVSSSLAGVEYGLPTGPTGNMSGGRYLGPTEPSWLESAFADLPGAILGAIQGGGNVGGSIGGLMGGRFFSDLAGTLTGGLTSALGKTLGGAVGSIIPGLGTILGGLGGSLVGKVVGGLFGKSEGWKKDRAADAELDKLRASLEDTYGGLENIDHIGKQIGIDLRGAWGDQSAKGLAHFQGLLEQFNAELARQKQLVSDLQAMKPGELLSDDLARQITGGHLTDETKEGLGQWMQGQAAFGVQSIGKIAANAPITSAAGAKGIGAGVAGVFAQLQEQGLSGTEIAAQMGPAIDELRKKFEAAGFSGGAAFDAIAASMSYLRDETVAPLLEGVSGVTGLMTSLANLGRLDQETFAGLAEEVSATHEQLTKAGKGGSQALSALAPDLQRIWELQQKFGYEVDASTQKLIDQALASGKIGEEFKDPQEKMLTAIDELVTRMGDFINTILGIPDAAGEAGGKIADRFPDEIRIPIHFDPENWTPPEGYYTAGAGGGVPHMAEGGVVTRPTYALIGEVGPEAVVPLGQLARITAGEAAAGVAAPVNISFTINAIDRAGVRDFIEQEALPAITEAVAGNTRQARTNLNAALGR